MGAGLVERMERSKLLDLRIDNLAELAMCVAENFPVGSKVKVEGIAPPGEQLLEVGRGKYPLSEGEYRLKGQVIGSTISYVEAKITRRVLDLRYNGWMLPSIIRRGIKDPINDARIFEADPLDEQIGGRVNFSVRPDGSEERLNCIWDVGYGNPFGLSANVQIHFNYDGKRRLYVKKQVNSAVSHVLITSLR